MPELLSLQQLAKFDNLTRGRSFLSEFVITDFDSNSQEYTVEYIPEVSPTSLLLRAAKEIICGRMGAERWLPVTIDVREAGFIQWPIEFCSYAPLPPARFFTPEREIIDDVARSAAIPEANTSEPPFVTTSTGARIESDLQIVRHPLGSFEDTVGNRFDVIIPELGIDPGWTPPDSADVEDAVSGIFSPGRVNVAKTGRLTIGVPQRYVSRDQRRPSIPVS